jgi:hypothetical protein
VSEERLRNLLGSLPRERASDGFTERVMQRLDEAGKPLFLRPRLVWATVTLLVAAGLGVHQWQATVERQRRDARIRSIKTQIEDVQKDIRLLRDLAPVLYLGGNENVDFVLDLKRLAGEEEATGRSRKGKIYHE